MPVDFSNNNKMELVCCTSACSFMFLVIHFYCILQKYPSMMHGKVKNSLILQHQEFEKPRRGPRSLLKQGSLFLGGRKHLKSVWHFFPFHDNKLTISLALILPSPLGTAVSSDVCQEVPSRITSGGWSICPRPGPPCVS